MNILYKAEKIVFAMQHYKNWAEVIRTSVTKQGVRRVILKNGIQLEAGEALNFLVHQIFSRRVYNPGNLAIGENDIVVDIGANYGVFTVFAASLTRNTVYAFEPSSTNFAFLERNIRLNGLNNIVAYKAAISATVGSTQLFFDPANDQGHLLSDFLIADKLENCRASTPDQFAQFVPDTRRVENYVAVDVSTTTLQEIMDRHNIEQIDFLKMDCEGAEGAILFATPKEYLQRVRKIAMEFHDFLSSFTHEDIQKRLEETGFITELKWEKASPLGYLYAWKE